MGKIETSRLLDTRFLNLDESTEDEVSPAGELVSLHSA
jgi:hypothetical protein